jgi:pilus assembly protein Flp/PilA
MIQMIQTYLEHYTNREEGATAVEYGIMVALIAVVIIIAVALLGTTLRDTFSEVASEISNAGS